MQGKLDEAISYFRRALQTKPEDTEVHCNLGYALELQGRLEEAIKEYRQALQINPDYNEASERLETALAKQRQNRQ